jgi:hypothetical protein
MSKRSEFLPSIPNGQQWALKVPLTLSGPPVSSGDNVPNYATDYHDLDTPGFVGFHQFYADSNFLRMNQETLNLPANILSRVFDAL